MKVGWIGLGVMGGPMASHLKEKGGHCLSVYNRSLGKAQNWVERYHGFIEHSPADVAQGASFVFSCVGNDEDVREITLGKEGAFHRMSHGAVFVDHSTVSAALAQELSHEAQLRGFSFIDAPVSGGQGGAERGVLSIMCGGERESFDAVCPLLSCYGKNIKYLGPAGSGQLAKMCNQIALVGVLQGLCESLNFGLRAGLDMSQVVSVMQEGAAGSWQMQNRSQSLLEGRFDVGGFSVDLLRKDLKICLDQARKTGASLEITALIDQFYGQIQKAKGGALDISSLMMRLQGD